MQKNNAPDSRPPYCTVIISLILAAGIINGYLNNEDHEQRFIVEAERDPCAIADLKKVNAFSRNAQSLRYQAALFDLLEKTRA